MCGERESVCVKQRARGRLLFLSSRARVCEETAPHNPPLLFRLSTKPQGARARSLPTPHALGVSHTALDSRLSGNRLRASCLARAARARVTWERVLLFPPPRTRSLLVCILSPLCWCRATLLDPRTPPMRLATLLVVAAAAACAPRGARADDAASDGEWGVACVYVWCCKWLFAWRGPVARVWGAREAAGGGSAGETAAIGSSSWLPPFLLLSHPQNAPCST